MDTKVLYSGLIFGSIGMGYLVYGKKQGKVIPLVCGLALCGIPYVVSNMFLLTAIGILLLALPFIIKY